MSDDFSYRENVPDHDATKETKGNNFVLNLTLFLSLHFPNSCCKIHYSKEKVGIPKTLSMDTLILNLKPFVSESSKKAVPQNIFPKLL